MDTAELSRRLASIGLTVATAPLVAMLPLVQVAWADGAVQREERDAIRAIARRRQLGPDATAILDRWLAVEPRREAYTTGQQLVVALVGRAEPPSLDPGTLEEIVAYCGGIAEAAGGLFGYGRVSAAEKAVIAEITAATGSTTAAGDSADWVCVAPATGPDDVALYSRSIPGAALKAFRGVSYAAAPLERAIGMLLDASLMKRWLFRCQEARVVAHDPRGDELVYLAVDGIWPLEDRDVVLRVRPELEAPGGIVFHGTAAFDVLPPVDGKVRIPTLTSTWRLTPLDGRVRLEWTGHVDPNGPAPAWLVNTMTVQVPRYALNRVHALLDDPAAVGPSHETAGRACLERLRS